ncbi:MAG TPA: hypothetical protein VGD41_14165, partial [Pyrinomonadaceae bacterium]
MRKKMWLASMLAAFLLTAGTVQAQSVSDKISALEQELQQLKEQQIELKKEATAAAAAMPSFSYRPGNGVNIEAADKAWGLRFTVETHFRYNFESGLDQQGRTQGQMMGRRFRPGVIYCINNCLWEIEATLDLDGWGTGNGKNNQATGVGSMLQRGAVNFHGENISPWLPTVQFGMEVQNAFGNSLSRQGSGATGAQAEYDLLTRNMGFNTGRAGSGVVLNWDDKDLSSIGIPGRIGKFQVGMSTVAEGDDGTQSLTDRQSFNVYGNISPFSQVKNKWISGLTFEAGTWFCNNDTRDPNGSAVCLDRFRVQDHGDGGRQTLFDSGSGSVGKGLATGTGTGIVWNVGPYTARIAGSWFQAHDDGGFRGKKRAHDFLIGHDLYAWSPKGFLTGSATTPGSILVGTHFERTDISVDCNGSSGITCATASGTTSTTALLRQFHRSRILLREWDLWYVIAPRMNVGVNWLWYDASNLGNRTNQAGYALGKCEKTNVGTATN